MSQDRLAAAIAFMRADEGACADAARRYNKDQNLKLKYGMELWQYERMVIEQRGLCYICKQAKPLNVDHCHKTGRVRKLLCTKCNTSLAVAEDAELLAILQKYVAEHA